MGELERRLKKVDPDLTVIPGHVRRGKRSSTVRDWLASTGVVCSNCHREVFRSRDGLCLECWEKTHEIDIRDKAGILNLLPESVIMEIVHPARKDQSG